MQRFKFVMRLFLFLFPLSLFAKSPIYTETQTHITIKSSQPTFIIKLKSNPTTGYEWSVNFNNKLLKLVRYMYESSYDPTKRMQMVGAPGYGVWTFELVPQPLGALALIKTTEVQFFYQRRWETNAVDHRTFNVILPSS